MWHTLRMVDFSMTTSGTAGDRPSVSTERTNTRLGVCMGLCVWEEGLLKNGFLFAKMRGNNGFGYSMKGLKDVYMLICKFLFQSHFLSV